MFLNSGISVHISVSKSISKHIALYTYSSLL